jgi:cytochrome c556
MTRVRKLPVLIGAMTAFALPSLAAEDPIAVRKLLMDSNGASAAVAGAIMKDEIPYSPAVGKSVLVAWHAVSAAFGDFFPEGSSDPANSKASPKIWEDPAGFQEQLAKFESLTAAGVAAAGRDGPADKAAFAAAAGPVFDACKTCHEGFRLSDN